MCHLTDHICLNCECRCVFLFLGTCGRKLNYCKYVVNHWVYCILQSATNLVLFKRTVRKLVLFWARFNVLIWMYEHMKPLRVWDPVTCWESFPWRTSVHVTLPIQAGLLQVTTLREADGELSLLGNGPTSSEQPSCRDPSGPLLCPSFRTIAKGQSLHERL